ncbi:MAG: hypothetical protein LUG54_05250 [Clostridiales bacterium]|nr:hypothetical protein [Clostridiales bacterium]
MSETGRRKAAERQLRLVLCRFCISILVMTLFIYTAVPICAQEGSVGSTHISGTVTAPDSSSDVPDDSENTVVSPGLSDDGKRPFFVNGALTGENASVIFRMLVLMAAAAAVGAALRYYYKNERYRFRTHGRKKE